MIDVNARGVMRRHRGCAADDGSEPRPGHQHFVDRRPVGVAHGGGVLRDPSLRCAPSPAGLKRTRSASVICPALWSRSTILMTPSARPCGNSAASPSRRMPSPAPLPTRLSSPLTSTSAVGQPLLEHRYAGAQSRNFMTPQTHPPVWFGASKGVGRQLRDASAEARLPRGCDLPRSRCADRAFGASSDRFLPLEVDLTRPQRASGHR